MAFHASRLEKQLATELKPIPNLAGVAFGTVFTDHMFIAEYSRTWKSLKIVPFQNISLPPQASVFQYSISVFEGMKAFKDAEGRIRLFRPDQNFQRFNRSCARVALPEVDCGELEKCLNELLLVESRWIPAAEPRGFSLYIRPTFIGTSATLGVKSATDGLLYIIVSPVGPYYPTGFKPVSLWACPEYCRAAPGGTGAFKIGANYAPTVRPGDEAHARNCQQTLWLYGPDKMITEVGAMNIMAIWTNRDGEKELITARLDEGLVLPGVTRDSVLELARQEDLKVTEGIWTIDDLLSALNEKRVIEMFGTGTAAIVAPVNKVLYEDKWFDVPIDATDPSAEIGSYARRFLDQLQDIQYGKIEHKWSVIVQ
jgi:branched-chain amino acid aminotransferase